MSLTLSVLTYRNQPPQRSISRIFSGTGGTIGRLDQNDLVLPDPERIVSRTHARVDFRAGSYFLTSLGQNPIDLNGRPLSPGGTAELSAGDRLTIGGYCIVADIESSGPIESRIPEADGLLNREPRAVRAGLPPRRQMPKAGWPSASIWEVVAGRQRFRASKAAAPKQAPLSSHGAQRDELPGFLEPLPPTTPAKTAQIPDDYDLLRGLDEQRERAERPSHAVRDFLPQCFSAQVGRPLCGRASRGATTRCGASSHATHLPVQRGHPCRTKATAIRAAPPEQQHNVSRQLRQEKRAERTPTLWRCVRYSRQLAFRSSRTARWRIPSSCAMSATSCARLSLAC